jgi:hypothetical protein
LLPTLFGIPFVIPPNNHGHGSHDHDVQTAMTSINTTTGFDQSRWCQMNRFRVMRPNDGLMRW